VRALAAAVLVALALPAVASAHATLIRSVPPAGTTLARSPLAVTLEFDDSVRVGPGVAAVRNGGASVLAGAARAAGRVETIPLRSNLPNGVYTVRWSVISDDGHLIQGVVPFRVGPGGAAEASLRVQAPDRPADVAARWAFLLGVLVAGGVAIFRLAVGRVERRLLAAGFALAIAGAAASLRLQSTHSTRYALALEVAIGVAAVGLALARTRGGDVVALGLLAVPTVSGHALDPGRSWLEVPADLAHVAAAAAWLGGLAALAAEPALARRFARVAIPATLVLAAGGVVRALSELAGVHQLWTTGYGRALLVKTGLFGAALAIGVANRRRITRPRLAAELGLLVVLVAAVGFLTDSRPGRRAAASLRLGEPAPLPPRDALVLAREDGPWAVALALRGREATVTVIGQDGDGVDGLDARIAGAAATSCGPGCYRATVSARPRLAVRLEGSRVSFAIPRHAPPAQALAERATVAFRALRSVAFTERLASGPGAALTTRWREQAPNRLAYRIEAGPEAVVVGARRWDRLPGRRWQRSATEAQRYPEPPWTQVSNVRLVAQTARTQTIAFLDRSIPAWFEVTIDRRSARPLEARMTATAHFMRHVYGSFDRAPPITPPR
jgi:methionine-rich copper-binding protein CopC/putative copper export protein